VAALKRLEEAGRVHGRMAGAVRLYSG